MEIKKEQIKKLHEGLQTCPEAQEAIKDAFPECFKEKEVKWVDITKDIIWTINYFSPGDYWLMGKYRKGEYVYNTENQFYFNQEGFHLNNSQARKDFKLETSGSGFCILKKQ